MELPARTVRFDPRGVAGGLPDAFKGDRRPLRYLGESDGYARLGATVLDLMSGRVSHLPEIDIDVTGLGLNADETGLNPRPSAHVVHDPNGNPEPPFDDAQFDAVVCAAWSNT